jgi:hypothetical protein
VNRTGIDPGRWSVALWIIVVVGVLDALAGGAWAHAVSSGDAAYLETVRGPAIVPYFYLGAKHMVTGYDHLLFLTGVIFFLYRLKHILIYVTMFSLGHSITLLSGVLGNLFLSPFLVDAVIGLSIVYKAMDNLGAFRTLFGFQPDARVMVFGFGLVHGFGLATKLQNVRLSTEGLVANMLSFNVGVEVGQILALAGILLAMNWWRSTPAFPRTAVAANFVLMAAGFYLCELQLSGYFSGATE